jgi:hypothetical protein
MIDLLQHLRLNPHDLKSTCEIRHPNRAVLHPNLDLDLRRSELIACI